MFTVKNGTLNVPDINHGWQVQQLKQAQNILQPKQIKAGNFYIYKENFGMICVVKVLKATFENDWAEFRLIIKQVLHSSWHVPRGLVFEVGQNTDQAVSPASWHFEPSMSLVKLEAHHSVQSQQCADESLVLQERAF